MAVLAQDLRDAVLQYALQGKLTEQLETDSSAEELVIKIKAEKEQLIKDKKIKKEKPLTEIIDEDKPFEVSEHWCWLKMGDIGIYRKGPFGSSLTKSMFVPKSENSVKVYEQKNAIQKDATIGEYYISKEYYLDKMQGFTLFPGDIIVSCAGTIGETFIMPENMELGIINQALMKMNITKRLNIDYFLCYFDYVLKAESQKQSKGCAIKNIPPFDIFKNMLIPIPPIEEQARIVAKVEEIMQKIDEYEKIEKQLESIKKAFPMDMRDALLQAAMQGKLTEQLDTDSSVDDLIEQIKVERQKLEAEGKIKKSKGKKKGQQNDYFVELPKDEYPYDIPENWKITNIQNVCTLYTGNSISESIKKSKYTNLKEGYNYIGTKDVEFNRTITYENGVKIPFSEEKFVYSYPNSTLLCIEGGSAGRKIAITKEKVCFGNKLCTFNPISINYKFLYYYLQSPLFLSAFNNSLSGIITGVSLNKIKELNFVIPPIEEQQRIVETLDRLLPLCETL